MNNIVLWVDDMRNPSDPQWIEYIESHFTNFESVVWVKNYKEFVDYIERGQLPRFISFDHDLGIDPDGIERSGYDCAKYMIDMLRRYRSGAIPDCDVHSANPVGAENIRKLIYNYRKFIRCD